MSISSGGPGPGLIVVEGEADFTVWSRREVGAVADQTFLHQSGCSRGRDALTGVTVAFASFPVLNNSRGNKQNKRRYMVFNVCFLLHL